MFAHDQILLVISIVQWNVKHLTSNWFGGTIVHTKLSLLLINIWIWLYLAAQAYLTIKHEIYTILKINCKLHSECILFICIGIVILYELLFHVFIVGTLEGATASCTIIPK